MNIISARKHSLSTGVWTMFCNPCINAYVDITNRRKRNVKEFCETFLILLQEHNPCLAGQKATTMFEDNCFKMRNRKLQELKLEDT